MALMTFDSSVCQNFSEAVEKEWLESNGLGGFASSTIIGANTRRYHGLLVAAMTPPLGRLVLLSKYEEELEIDGVTFPLSSNIYFNAVHPDGFSRLERFSLEPNPVFTFRAGEVEVRKEILMIHGENTVVVSYTITGLPDSADVRLHLRPLIAFRDYHCHTHANDDIARDYQVYPGCVVFQPYSGVPQLYLYHPPCELLPTGYWYRNFEYPNEVRRGLDYREDLFNPCQMSFSPRNGEPVQLVASLDKHDTYPVEEKTAQEKHRRALILETRDGKAMDRRLEMLLLAADSFIVKRAGIGSGRSIIAGYHWFGDWGRDTLIALPGLTLCTGQADVARTILLTFARQIKYGLVPNLFADHSGEALYNSVDASLWFVNAVYEYATRTDDFDTVKSWFLDPLKQIIAAYREGTLFNIRMDEDGLISAGAPGVQLTWMDAKVNDWVVTQRHGKPVEINALWYNALRIMETFAEKLGLEQDGAEYGKIAALTRASFNRLFWNEALGCLYDVIDKEHKDASIRPNQVFAISLPYPVLDEGRWAQMLSVVDEHLVTPYGLRTLSPSDPKYHGRYEGNPTSRDSAYHQGIVWPWLMGSYLTAKMKAGGRDTEAVKKELWDYLEPLLNHLEEGGLGSVSEIYDGDSPHRPKGCISQAWSVAELLRVLQDNLGALEEIVQTSRKPVVNAPAAAP
ncbi:amylo-alpha-1,6-glucosidase [Acidobacteriota bacterium]